MNTLAKLICFVFGHRGAAYPAYGRAINGWLITRRYCPRCEFTYVTKRRLHPEG